MSVPDLDEGPSSEDLARFGGEEVTCPECGQALWDQASVCPGCGAAVEGESLGRPARRRKWAVLLALGTAAAFLAWILFRIV